MSNPDRMNQSVRQMGERTPNAGRFPNPGRGRVRLSTAFFCLVVALVASPSLAQENQPPAPGLLTSAVQNDAFSLLSDAPDSGFVARELELTDRQRQKIKKTLADGEDRYQELFRKYDKPQTDETASQSIVAEMDENRLATRKAVFDVLEPEQQQRLFQLALYNRQPLYYFASVSTLHCYFDNYVCQVAGLSRSQQRELAQVASELKVQFRAEYVELNRRYRQELTQGLSRKERHAVDDALGSIFFGFDTSAIDQENRK